MPSNRNRGLVLLIKLFSITQNILLKCLIRLIEPLVHQTPSAFFILYLRKIQIGQPIFEIDGSSENEQDLFSDRVKSREGLCALQEGSHRLDIRITAF